MGAMRKRHELKVRLAREHQIKSREMEAENRRLLARVQGQEEENERLYRDWKFTAGLVDSLQALLKQAHSIIADGVRENNELTAELAELKAIIALIDGRFPLADDTCLEPGITLSEAARRELAEQGGIGR